MHHIAHPVFDELCALKNINIKQYEIISNFGQKIKMNKKIFTITENGLDQNNLKTLIHHIIEEHINTYKLQHLSNWIKNNEEPIDSRDQKIKELEYLKEELNSLFDVPELVEDVSIALQFKFKDRSKAA